MHRPPSVFYLLGIPQDDEPHSHPRVSNFRQFYILLHYANFFLFSLGNTTFIESCLSDTPYFFCTVVILYCLSLDCYSNACHNPSKVTREPANTEHLFFCKTCNLHCPVRAGHCHVCGYCVLRRDHHCPWTGCCIGRDNHLAFIGFLLLESIVTTIAMLHVVRRLIQPAPIWDWMRQNWIGFWLVGSIGFDGGLVLLLLYIQIRQVLRNETVWEVSRRETISYLKNCTLFQRPFDRGAVQNVIEFCTMGFDEKEWELPRPATLEDYVQEQAELPGQWAVRPLEFVAPEVRPYGEAMGQEPI